MKTADMVRMANQISGFFKNYGPEQGKAEVANHINNFWEPRMRNAFFAYLDKGGAGFDELVLAAAPSVRKPGVEKDVPEPHDRDTGLPKDAKES